MRLTAGRDIPDTDQERVAFELRKFDAQIAVKILRALTDAIHNHHTGWIRPNILITDGVIKHFAMTVEEKIDLDDGSGITLQTPDS